MEVPFEKYLYCDNLYQGYLQTKSESVLTELAQILYDSEHLRPNTTQWIGVFYWFASLKSFFARKFHHFLQPVSNESANLLESTPIQQRVEESMNSQIRALTKGDITKEKQILKKVAIKFGDSKSFLYLVGRYLLFNLLNMRNIVESDSNVILLSPGLFPEIVEEIKEKCGKHGIRVAFCGSKDNIWVRDYMPIQLSDDCFLEYQYTPDYLLSSKRYSKYLVTSEHFVEDTLEKTTKQLGLVIDGGNVVKLADKYVAMTEKVMVENPRYSQTDIESIIRDCFHREVLWLPWDKAEIYGHSDGIVNYLNGTVVMTNYSDFDKNIARQVHERLIKAGYEVKQLEYSFKRGFHRRSWCYVNFVETQNVVLVPRLGVEEDSEAVEQLSKITPKPIETINALSLVRRGGAIHCATWNIYQ